MATLYKLLDPDTHEVRYIGVTTIPYLNSRLCVHIRKARLGIKSNPALSDWINELLAKGKKPLIKAIMEVDKKDKLEAETTLIQAFKLVGHNLFNRYKMY